MTQATFDIDQMILDAHLEQNPWTGSPLHFTAAWYPISDHKAAWQRWIDENGRMGCIPRSHMWHTGYLETPTTVAGHTLTPLSADVRCDCRGQRGQWIGGRSRHPLDIGSEQCPDGVRVAAWHRGARVTPGVIATAWEPVIFFGSRHVVADPRDTSDSDDIEGRDTLTRHDASQHPDDDASSSAAGDMSLEPNATRPAHRVDSLVYRPGVRRTDPSRVVGAKPAAFAGWLFRLLGALPGDTLTDLYPGSGGISRAWEHWIAQPPTKETR